MGGRETVGGRIVGRRNSGRGGEVKSSPRLYVQDGPTNLPCAGTCWLSMSSRLFTGWAISSLRGPGSCRTPPSLPPSMSPGSSLAPTRRVPPTVCLSVPHRPRRPSGKCWMTKDSAAQPAPGSPTPLSPFPSLSLSSPPRYVFPSLSLSHTAGRGSSATRSWERQTSSPLLV